MFGSGARVAPPLRFHGAIKMAGTIDHFHCSSEGRNRAYGRDDQTRERDRNVIGYQVFASTKSMPIPARPGPVQPSPSPP